MHDEAKAAQAKARRAAQAQANRLRREAREAKRASRFHRDRAKELMRQLDELVQSSARRGIHITINAQPTGGQSGNNSQQGQAREEHAPATAS